VLEHHAQFSNWADEAMRRLVDGNARFVRGELSHSPLSQEAFDKLARGQEPYAAILGCSDSRVPPELIFDVGFGDLFVVRVAGNTVTPEVAGSLQFAGVHLHTPLLVVLGHEKCGAITAAMEMKLHGSRQQCGIQLLVDAVLPALSRVDHHAPPEAQLAQAVEDNVRWTMARIVEARIVGNRMKLAGAVYEIATGRVRFLTERSASYADSSARA